MKLLMFEDENDHITLYDNIDSYTLDEVSQAAARIDLLLKDLKLINGVTDAFNELKETCLPSRIPHNVQHEKIEQKARAFLSEFHIFLNYWNKKTKNQSQNHAALYQKVTSHIYDTTPEYCFIYRLRNYTTHVGKIVSRIHGNIDLQYIQPLANKSYLLQTFDKKWKDSDRAFIEAQPEYFDLLPIFEKGIHSIQTIHDELMNSQITPQTIYDCNALITLHEEVIKLNTCSGNWDIIEFFDQDNSPLLEKEIANHTSLHCWRCCANWNVYPAIKTKAECIIAKRKMELKSL